MEGDRAFGATIAQVYESHLVPLLFEPYAATMAERLEGLRPMRVLEIAAGTGVLTRAMSSRLPAPVEIMATDLNQAMLDRAIAVGPSWCGACGITNAAAGTERSMSNTSDAAASLDAYFREAVVAIDAGNIGELERLITASPSLVRERLASPSAWLRDKVGSALDGFFQRPYLLWFVAEDPVRNGTLPENIVAVAHTIVDAARRESKANLQEQLDYALSLVSWSWIARQHGVQLSLIDVLVDAGAAFAGSPNNALVNGNFAAAEHLVKRGADLTLEVALCLGWWDDVERLLPAVSDNEKQFAFVLVALHGKSDALRRLILAGADLNAPSVGLYSHGTPLHHAVCSGSLDAVTALVEAGANPNVTDSAWGGTPLGWAQHYLGEGQGDRPHKEYAEIAAYLRSCDSSESRRPSNER